MSELLIHLEGTTIAVSPSRLVAAMLLDDDPIRELRVGTTIERADESALIDPVACSESIASLDESTNSFPPMVSVAPEKDVHPPVVKIDESTLAVVRVVFLKFVW